MTEKKLFHSTMIRFAAILIFFTILTIVLDLTCGNNLVEVFDGAIPDAGSTFYYDATEMMATVEDPATLELVSMYNKNKLVYVNIKGLKEGTSKITYYMKDTGEFIYEGIYEVSWNHSVIDDNNGNYSNWTLQRELVICVMLICTLILWESFFTSQSKVGYSYHSIFCCGFGIWNLLADISMIRSIITDHTMNAMYQTFQTLPSLFMQYTAPVMLLFAVAMTISNIFLIRHEGYRITNVLGIGISVAMVLGEVLYFGFIEQGMMLIGHYTPTTYKIQCTNFASLYCLMECFLLGAIICGTIAATHEPRYDKDYIVILGCKVRKDGTLYPLIKGRVDRAIVFYQTQLEKTGKKAIFVPSGGQGSDEQISEAAAMKNYLLTRGFKEEDIMIEDQSKNTRENMQFSKRLIEARTPGAKVAFSTTNYHVFRSGIISRQQDFQAEGMGGRTKWYFWPNAYVREMVGMIVYCWHSLVIILAVLISLFSIVAMH